MALRKELDVHLRLPDDFRTPEFLEYCGRRLRPVVVLVDRFSRRVHPSRLRGRKAPTDQPMMITAAAVSIEGRVNPPPMSSTPPTATSTTTKRSTVSSAGPLVGISVHVV
jgi:hypothetical protein